MKYFTVTLVLFLTVILACEAMISTVITGCRTGIGLELVKQLSRVDNALVIATYRDLTRASELKGFADANKNVKLLNLDVTAFDTFDKFAQEVKNIVGDEGLSSVIHNAGILLGRKSAKLDEVKAKDLIDMYTTNTVGPIMLTQALLPLIKKSSEAKSSLPLGYERGSIFFISSDLASHANNKIGSYWGYRESKTAINMAMQTIKIELANSTIGAMSIHPGWVKTNMGGDQAPITPKQSVEGIVKLITNFSDKSNGLFYRYDGKELPW